MRARPSPAVATLYSADTPVAGASLTLGSDAASHIRALRLSVGAAVLLTDGRGTKARAILRALDRSGVHLDVGATERVPRFAELHALVPVADRERMLWLAEKCVELEVTSWRPVHWRRSRSVAGRGEGAGFRRKLIGRMRAALEQSGSAWLPDIFPESDIARAIAAAPRGDRLMLHQDAGTDFPRVLSSPAVIVIGPEGGMEEGEVRAFESAGFAPARMVGHTLRFETAGVVAIALARSALAHGGDNGRE